MAAAHRDLPSFGWVRACAFEWHNQHFRCSGLSRLEGDPSTVRRELASTSRRVEERKWLAIPSEGHDPDCIGRRCLAESEIEEEPVVWRPVGWKLHELVSQQHPFVARPSG